jgi:CRISPR-associated protein Csb1
VGDLYPVIESAVAHKSLFRIVVRLKPANADGLVYPPTYDQGGHIFRPAWIDGECREAVLLDSVQSQANRIETALLMAMEMGDIDYPDIRLNIRAGTGPEAYSVLELSHRVYDAALRMSRLDGVAFSESAIGKAIYSARSDSASALFEHAPITLVLGGWDSHGGGGPLAARMPRLITSEMVGLDAKAVTRAAVKSDPMDIRKDAGPIYESKRKERRFEIEKAKAAGRKVLKPSEIGLGSVPHMAAQGAVITEAVQTSVVSCTAARRLKFEHPDGRFSPARDRAGRTAVLALALYGLLAQMDEGYCLRSGCDLIPMRNPELEVIGRTLEDVDTTPIDVDSALAALKAANNSAAQQGLRWRDGPLVVDADERLVTLVERSRNAAIAGDN